MPAEGLGGKVLAHAKVGVLGDDGVEAAGHIVAYCCEDVEDHGYDDSEIATELEVGLVDFDLSAYVVGVLPALVAVEDVDHGGEGAEARVW